VKDELDLFPGSGPMGGDDPEADRGTGAVDPGAPLAARMRPRTLDEFRGQGHLLGTGRPLRVMIDAGAPTSMILWGPPGSGKTTLARLIAEASGATFVAFSAVTEGIARVREIIAEARRRLATSGRRTILFCDEIHRFNRAQQDAFLPHVEEGVVVLIGATTENPSFEIVRPLLSRAPVRVLEPLDLDDVRAILGAGLRDSERGLGGMGLTWDEDALDLLAEASDGDARRALGALEAAAAWVGEGGRIDAEAAREGLQHRFAVYDKGGEEHYNLISALHKSVRGSDPDASLYWLARMIDGGEDPLYIARRLVRMAAEDVGLAEPSALAVTMAARDAFHFLGSPEGELALAEAVVYLATAPKSNRLYMGWQAAARRARETTGEPVPLHARNAPTSLMKELGYGRGYRYDPDEEHGVADQTCLPDRLVGERFYEPGPYGREPAIRDRLEWWAERRKAGRQGGGDAEPDPPRSSGPPRG
jgi:putative ATPase